MDREEQSEHIGGEPRTEGLKPHQLTEILIQYGHLQSDLMELNFLTASSTEKQHEAGMVAILAFALPFAVLQGIYAFFSVCFPALAIAIVTPFYHMTGEVSGPSTIARPVADALLLDSFHSMVFVVGLP